MNRPIWNSALTPLLFIVAALLSGGALITFLSYAFKRDDQLITTLGRIILYLLLLFVFLEGLQFFVGYQTGLKNVVAALDLIGSGPYWWTFWIVHLLIGSLIPILLLLARGQRQVRHASRRPDLHLLGGAARPPEPQGRPEAFPGRPFSRAGGAAGRATTAGRLPPSLPPRLLPPIRTATRQRDWR